jgi:hypothetical protein
VRRLNEQGRGLPDLDATVEFPRIPSKRIGSQG